MRYLVPAVVVLILVLGALIAYRMHNRTQINKRRLYELNERYLSAQHAIEMVRREVSVQSDVGHDMFGFKTILADYDSDSAQITKEISK